MNEVEIVITGRNKAKPAVQDAQKDATDLGKTYKETGKTATSALSEIRSMLSGGLRDSIADVNGETSRISRVWRSVQESVTKSVDDVRDRIKTGLSGALGEDDGRSIGRRLMSGLGDGVKAAGGPLKSALSTTMKGAVSAATSTPVIGGVVVAAVAGLAAVIAPALAAAIAGGVVLGIGTSFVKAGITALFTIQDINEKWSKAEQERVKKSNQQAEELQKEWSEVGRDITLGLKESAQPLIPVLDTLRSVIRDVGSEFKPVIKAGYELAAGPLKSFVKDLGKAALELKPALAPLMTAFGDLLDEIGPQLPGLFSEISGAITDLAGTVSENSDLIGGMFVALLRAIPLVLGLLSTLTGTLRTVLLTTADVIDGLLGGVQSLMEAVAKIPGPWQQAASDIAREIQGSRDKIANWRRDVENFPRIVKLEGDIKDLETKIATAKEKLNDPNLTRERKAQISADIGRLVAARDRAQREIDSLRGKTVTITAVVKAAGNAAAMGALGLSFATGGVVGTRPRRYAAGGVTSASGTPAIVGEHGPELVNLPFGATVTPAGATRTALTRGGGGGGSSTVTLEIHSGGTHLDDLLVEILRKAVRVRGGDVQVVLGGSR